MGTVVGGRMYHSQTWETQAVPYKLVGNPLDVKGTDTTTPTFTIEKGNTILVSPETTIRMGNAGFIAAGTPTAPITITRLDEQSAPWGRLLFKNGMFPESRMEYTNVSYAGGEGAISFDDEHGNLTLDHVQVQHNLQAGILHEGRFMQIKDSTIQFNGVGIKIQYDADALLRRNTISANQEGGLLTYANGDICIDAIHIYWGSPNGPNDTIDTQDACNAATTNDSTGDSVGEGVLYSPWMGSSDEISVQGTSRISADPYWVIADGKQQTTLEITVRDLAGNPLEDKQIEIQATLGTITQPTSLTDEQGVTRAILYSSEVGDAIITARNVTDNTPLAGLAAVHFWRGTGGDTAGLVDSGGVPYASPNLILEGLPFIQGLPMTFRLPMQNTNADPVDVEVSYAVTGLNIGEPFSEVDVVASTIQPGETWDAPGGWIVDVTGHHCVKAFAKVTLPDGTTLQETVNVGPFQVNFDVPKDPCKKTDATKLIPRSAGVSGVRKHTQKLLIQTYLVKECLKQQLTFGNNSSALSSAAPSAERDYQTIVSVPDLTPPQFTVDDTMTAEQVDALNALGTTAAELCYQARYPSRAHRYAAQCD